MAQFIHSIQNINRIAQFIHSIQNINENLCNGKSPLSKYQSRKNTDRLHDRGSFLDLFWLDAGSFLAHFRSITIQYPDWEILYQLSERLVSLDIMEARLRTPTILKPLNTIVLRRTGGFQGEPGEEGGCTGRFLGQL